MTEAPKKAMLFAAGLGTRMRPITNHIPKPLVKVMNKTLLDWALDNLAESGVEDVVVNTHYMADKVKQHLKGRKFPKITLSHEEVLLETGGGILKVLDFFDNKPFYSVNSDVILIDNKKPKALQRLAEEWDNNMDALLLLQDKKKAVGYDGNGDFELGNDNKLKKENSSDHKYVFTGIQILNPKIFRNSPDGPFSLNIFYKRAMKENKEFANIYGIEHTGGWLHIGTPESIKQAEEYLANS